MCNLSGWSCEVDEIVTSTFTLSCSFKCCKLKMNRALNALSIYIVEFQFRVYHNVMFDIICLRPTVLK